MLNSILLILCLIGVSAFFSLSEISLAASRKIKLKLMADEGNINAMRVLKMQENPGMFFTVVQIGLNAVAILGGIVGDAAFITSDDIYAVVEAGALAGVLRKQEHELIENVFELESRTVPSSMTSRENIVWFDLHEDEQSLKNKIAEHPHSKFLVCNDDIDHIVGYVDSKELLNRVLGNQSLALNSGVQIRNTLIVPDTLTLSEALESFKTAGEDFAVIMNEYALVVGLITLNDVMTTLMGDLVGQGLEEQIVARDENSWLIDGGTPIDDVMRVLDIDEFPQSGNYETIGGFMMFMLRKIPKRTDSVKFSGYKFEVVDIDNYRIDQLLVTRIDNKPTVLVPRKPEETAAS